MKFTKRIIASAVLLTASSIAIAATDTTTVEINVTKDAYVNLTGSLSSGPTISLAIADVDNTSTILGNMGSEANTVGGCDFSITSSNGFKLQHSVNAALFLHGVNEYNVTWGGVTYSTANSAGFSPTCNNADLDIAMNSPAIVGVVQAGTYSDTLTVTVITQ